MRSLLIPGLEGLTIHPGTDTEFTLDDLELLFETIGGFAASTALCSNL
jgi:hypothetical protein